MTLVKPIGIINSGLGNVGSIKHMIEKVGYSSIYITHPDQLYLVSKIVLPGVGHFDTGVESLIEKNFFDEIRILVSGGNLSVLGICLGMQLLCTNSEEGEKSGLGLIDANVKRFYFNKEDKLKVPHMGWNKLRVVRNNSLIPYDYSSRFYFVHSFYVQPVDEDITIATALHGFEFCAAIQKGNVFGVQFHPEKSHRFGMALIRRFVEI